MLIELSHLIIAIIQLIYMPKGKAFQIQTKYPVFNLFNNIFGFFNIKMQPLDFSHSDMFGFSFTGLESLFIKLLVVLYIHYLSLIFS